MDQMSLFSMESKQMNQNVFDMSAPLASRLRPTSLEDYIGQEHLLGKGKILRQMIEKDQIPSMV